MDPQAKRAGPGDAAPRRDRLDHYVTQLVGDSKLPLFSKRLLDILALGTQDRTSAHKLADLVMEDYALTVNVLRMANSFALQPLEPRHRKRVARHRRARHGHRAQAGEHARLLPGVREPLGEPARADGAVDAVGARRRRGREKTTFRGARTRISPRCC
jgi:hypothetical protein